MTLPKFNDAGDLPIGLHRATIDEVLIRFGEGTYERRVAADRLQRIYEIAISTGHVERFIAFGSFITDEPQPNDVDVFLLMDDEFDAGKLSGEMRRDTVALRSREGSRPFWR